jgi:phasin family protein
MLRVTTLGDAMALNAGFARQSFDALIGSSAKLSEIGVKLATEASRPLLSRFGESLKSSSTGI